MKLAFATATALSALALSGCISVKRTPFATPIEAQQLRQIDATPLASAAAAEQDAHPAADAPAAVAAAAPEAVPAPAPARTDIKGAGDGSMKTDVVTITGKTIPHRAPNYSPEQTASMVCASQKGGFNVEGARKAHEATVYAKEMRDKLAAGTATLKQSDAAELKRQDAVIAARTPGPVIGLLVAVFGDNKKSDLPKPKYRDVLIEDTDLYTFKENGKDVMAVSGIIHNTGNDVVELPPLTFEALDEWDFVLAGQSTLLPFETIAPGESRPFEARFLNPPEYTGEVAVHFAPPFSYRSRRDCDFFAPSKFTADAKLDAAAPAQAMAPAPQVGAGAPAYTAAELNLLTQYYRRESATVWRCRDADKTRCLWTVHALPWRDMFAMSEAIDEAWIAVRAAEETRIRVAAGTATDADNEKAERDRQSAIHRFEQMGDRALARAGGSVPDVKVALADSTYGLDEKGRHISFSGTVTNTGSTPRHLDALMIAFVDRFELPLSSVAVDFPKDLAPGETVSFSQRVPARANGGLNSLEIEIGKQPDTLARIPPPPIVWQLRVGAMGK